MKRAHKHHHCFQRRIVEQPRTIMAHAQAQRRLSWWPRFSRQTVQYIFCVSMATWTQLVNNNALTAPPKTAEIGAVPSHLALCNHISHSHDKQSRLTSHNPSCKQRYVIIADNVNQTDTSQWRIVGYNMRKPAPVWSCVIV